MIETLFPYGMANIFVGKKNKNAMDIIAGLALNGKSDTYELAKYVIHKDKDYIHAVMKISNVTRTRGNVFHKLIEGRLEKRTGRKKIPTPYLGLVEEGFVFEFEKQLNSKNKFIPKYYLTLKGCILALGFKFDDDELKIFIENASKNYIVFAYLNMILFNTSMKFIRDIFITPLQIKIKQKYFNLDLDIRFYFSNIAELSEYSLVRKFKNLITRYYKENRDMNTSREYQYIEKMIDCTKYYEKRPKDYEDRLVEFYFPNEDDAGVYGEHSEKNDFKLLYKVMRSIHYGYFTANNHILTPTPRKKLPMSKELRRHKKYKKRSKEDIKLLKRLKSQSKF